MSPKKGLVISPDNKEIAQILARSFEAPIRVIEHWDEREKSSVFVFSASDRPIEGATSFGTIGLSDHEFETDQGKAKFGLELLGACDSDVDEFGDVLATAAFSIINSHWRCFPGAIFPDVVAMYDISKSMTSVCFVDPYLWASPFSSVQLKTKRVAWLQLVPISRAEEDYARQNGFEALQQLFLKNQIEVKDINRPSVV